MTATGKDRDILARPLWREARGAGLDGQIAVARTIRHRVLNEFSPSPVTAIKD
jgi:spore germination cell wall hydrolase CwlJ-like protein